MTNDGMAAIPEGWYRDPAGGALERYYDGTGWTLETRPVELRRRGDVLADGAPTGDEVVTPAVIPAVTQVAALAVAPGTGAEAGAGWTQTPSPMPAFQAAAPVPAAVGTLPAPSAPSVPSAPAARGWGSAAPADGAGPAVGTPRRSLTDALGTPVDARSAQQLLLGTATELPPRSLRTTPGPTPAGWYPDPARSGGLRFFDGTRWTGRTRRAADDSVRHLPSAALLLRARVLDAQDAAAVRRGPKTQRGARLVIPREASAPSLRTRSRSGSMWGMLSTLLMVVGLAAAALFAWQLWGTDYQNTFEQRKLEQILEDQPETGFGDVPVVIERAPTPEAGATPARQTSAPAAEHKRNRENRASDSDGKSGGREKPARTESRPSPPRTTRVKVSPAADADGRPVGRISIPAIGLTRVFVLGTDIEDLALGPGLWKWGSFPGTPGNATISGHRTTHGAPFLKLNELRYGDRIFVDVPGQPRAVYEVRGQTIANPFDVRVTKQTAGVRLTLTTCNPVGSVRERLVIQAELVSGKYADQALSRSQWRLLR